MVGRRLQGRIGGRGDPGQGSASAADADALDIDIAPVVVALDLLDEAVVAIDDAGGDDDHAPMAVMEAVARGCLPVLPARLVYPELYPAHCCYASHPDDAEREAESAVALLLDAAKKVEWATECHDMSIYSVHQLAPRYEQVFRGAIGSHDSHWQ